MRAFHSVRNFGRGLVMTCLFCWLGRTVGVRGVGCLTAFYLGTDGWGGPARLDAWKDGTGVYHLVVGRIHFVAEPWSSIPDMAKTTWRWPVAVWWW